MLKKQFALAVMAAILLLSLSITCVAASTEAIEAADALHTLGLFNGTGTDNLGNPIYELDRAPSRHEAITMLVRLLGKDAEALNGNWVTPFTDVADWAKPYVGYAYANGLTSGTSATTFSGNNIITTSQYITFVLRALGYDSNIDFQWDKAWEFSDSIGLTDGRYAGLPPVFLRSDVAIISRNALVTPLKNSEELLIDRLTAAGVVSEAATGVLNPHAHEWGDDVIERAAGCGTEGALVNLCKVCGTTKRSVIPALQHNYQVTGVINPTCLTAGNTHYACTYCGAAYNTTVPAYGHSLNSSNVCTRCGEYVRPTLNMSEYDREMSAAVYYITERSIQFNDATNSFTLFFGLLDYNQNAIAAPAYVDIYIKNSSGDIVYKATKTVKQSDFCTWTNGYGKSFYAVGINIYASEITVGSSDSGTIGFTVYNPEYFTFDETLLSIYGHLPKVNLADRCSLLLPSTPKTISFYDYSGKLKSSAEVTEIDYEFVESYDGTLTLHIYFSGYKRFDLQGSNRSDYCRIGWKLYDNKGYVVDSGTNLTPNLAEREYFRDSESYVFDLKPGTYRLEILDVRY